MRSKRMSPPSSACGPRSYVYARTVRPPTVRTFAYSQDTCPAPESTSRCGVVHAPPCGRLECQTSPVDARAHTAWTVLPSTARCMTGPSLVVFLAVFAVLISGAAGSTTCAAPTAPPTTETVRTPLAEANMAVTTVDPPAEYTTGLVTAW